MITQIFLENFKAFGSKIVIPTAPITLFYGENSAGKSSILHALSLLKQSRESSSSRAVLLPRTDNGYIDLGSYSEMVFDHDTSRTLSIGLVGRSADTFGKRLQRIGVQEAGVKLDFTSIKTKKDILLNYVHLLTKVPEKDSEICATFRMGEDKTTGSYSVASIDEIVANSPVWARAYLALSDQDKVLKDEISSQIVSLKSLKSHAGKKQTISSVRRLDESIDVLESIQAFLRILENRRERYSGFLQGMSTHVNFHGFLPTQDSRKRIDPKWRLLRELGMFENTPVIVDTADLLYEIGDVANELIGRISPLGPFRIPPARWYEYNGIKSTGVGFRGQQLPNLLYEDARRSSKLIVGANDWLHRMGIDYKLETKVIGKGESGLFELRLVDARRVQTGSPQKVTGFSLPDVGFGVSQLLPLLIQALLSKNQIITVEQPEVHIHPRLQANLGDLLAHSVKENNNQFLIETHSEHLALRLLKLIRQEKLQNTDVLIVFVERATSDKGSTVVPIRLGSDGDFIDEFPGGFFPERIDELF